MDDEMILNDQAGENSEQMESDIAFPQSVSYTDMARAALTLAKKRNSDRGAAVLRKSAETGLPATFWQQADNSMLTPQKGTVDQLPDSGKRCLVENPQVADVFKNDLQAIDCILWESESGGEKLGVLNANLPVRWRDMISEAVKLKVFDEVRTSEDVSKLPAEELASIAIRKAMYAHIEARGAYPQLVQLGRMLIWGEAAQKILTPNDSSVFGRYYARRGFTPLQMAYCRTALNWEPIDPKQLPNGRTKVAQWRALNTVFMQGRGNDPVVYNTVEDLPAGAVPRHIVKREERQRRLALAGEHRHDFDNVKTMRQLRNGTNGSEYVRQLMMEIRTMAVLTQRYGDKWHDFSDEALEEAFKSIEAETGVPAVMLSVKRFRPADAGSFDKIEKLWDFFAAGSLAERVVRAHGDELLEIYKNYENATYADNLALVENSGLEELHRQMRGKTWGYQLLNVGAYMVPLVVECLVTMSPAPALARGVSAKAFLRKAAAFFGKRTLSELPTVMVNTANAVEDYRIDWLTGEIGDRKDIMETFSQQFLNTSTEILSEVMGGAISGFVGKGMRAGLSKALPESVKQSLMATTIAGAYKTASQKAFVKAAKKVAEAGGWTDTLSEYLEEKGGGALRFALTRIGEATDIQHLNLGQESIFGSVQEEAELFSLVAALGVGFGTIPAIATGVDVAKAMAYSNRQLELNKRIQESEAAKSSPEATDILLRQYTRFQEEAAYLHAEDAAAIIESNPEIAEKLGINTELVDYAIDHGVSVPVDMVAAQTRLDTPELQTLLDNIIPPSGGGMTIKEIRDLSLEQSDLDRAQTIDNERKAVRAAIEEKVSQLESLGRPAKEIRAFTRLMSFADYLARHSNTSVSQWIKNLKIQQMKEADFLRMLEDVPEGVRYHAALQRKPRNIRDFLEMPGHIRPERVAVSSNTPMSELFDIFKEYILEGHIETPEGYVLRAKEGHFYSFCCGKKDGTSKGFIKRARNAEEALLMVKNNEVSQSELSGFQLDRIRNIRTYIDVMTDPDFSYRDGDKILYGKKYDDVKKANGFTSVVLDLQDNTLSPVHSGFSEFTEANLGKFDIKWYTEMDSRTPLESTGTTESVASREQLSDRFGSNISPSGENVNPETEKNSKIFNQGEGPRKGAISFGEAFEATVTVFEGKGDLSTLCHETGHYILGMMRRLVASDLGDAQMESDLQALEKWMARDTTDPEAQDEKLARGFEQYLREGKSPSPKLDGAFATFREILRRIYHTAKMLNVEINDEVRNVFDRILSSDQTVSDNAFLREVAQKLDLGLLGLNDEERKSFTGLMAQANQQAVTQMEKEKASQLKALKTQWRKDAKNAMAEMPEYAVWEEIKVLGRMDYDSVKELAGEDIANKLHDRGLAVKKRTNQKGEINAFFPAEFLPADGSFGSLEGMLRTLAGMEPPADFTSRYLTEREAEFNAEFEMSEAALTTQASVDSYDRLIELLAVKGGQEGYRIRRQEMKVKAQEIIEQLSVGGILSKKLDNDCRAGLREVVSAANKKDYATAFEEARKLRANIEVLRLRGAAKERISRFGQLRKKVRNAKLGKIEGTHQDALNALFVLLGLYSPKTVEKRWGEALESILKSLKDEYDGIGELEALLNQKPFMERAYGDFLQLAQFAEYIYEAGRAEVSDGKMAFKRQVSEDVNSALEAMGDVPPGKAKRNETGVSAKTLNYAFDSNEQLRNIWGKMCGNDPESPAYAPYKRLMVAASEQLRLQQPLLRKVGDALKALAKAGKTWNMEGLPTIPESIVNAGNYTRWTPDMVLAVCLNLGCAKNRQRLQEAYGFTDVDLENITGRLSKADWDNIQMVWDAINAPELVSAAQKAYRDEFFADMPLEEAFGFDVRSSDAQDLQIKGGYYPLAYLPNIGTPDGSVNTESADSNPLRRPGFTYSRKEGVKRAIRLSPTVAIGHINDVAHYATHREAVRLMARIIGDSRFRNKFQESQGFNRYRTLVKRVQAVANPKEFIQSMGDMERYLRSVLTTSALWGNLSTVGMQFASAFVGVDEVKGYYLPSLMATWVHTLKDYVSGNAEGRMDTPYARAVTLSGLMRDRMNLRDYDLGALRSRMDKGLFSAILKPVNMAGFMLSNAMDTMVTVPIWDAAYRQAVDEGKSVEEAVAVADELVAKTQGAYRPLDQTSAQTDPGFVRYATAFMSPAVAQYNTTLRAFRKLKTQGLKESWMAIACSVASPLLMGALIRWAYAGDDEDKAERAALRETIGFWTQGIPVVRDIVDAVINASTGGWQGGSAVSTTVGEGVEALQKPLVAAGKAVEKQEFERAVWKLAEAISIALKAPVIPAYRRLRKTFMDHGADKYFLPPVPGDKR